jgi:hypothetical protein
MANADPTDLSPVHDIAFACLDVFPALAALGEALAERGGAMKGLTIMQGAGAHAVRARIEGVDPQAARGLTESLAARADVTHAAVEHIIWRKNP